MKIAYVLGEFPSISETFILREIVALKADGVDVCIVSLNRSRGQKVHPEAEPLADDVLYGCALTGCDCVRSLLQWAREEPRRLAVVLGYVLGQLFAYPRAGLRFLRWFPVAAALAREARSRGIDRIHAHFAFSPADVAIIMSRLLQVDFSLAVHARDIYVQKERDLIPKLEQAAFVVVCTGAAELRILRTCPTLDHERLVRAYHGVAVAEFTPAERDGDIVLGIGRLIPKKGFNVLIEACSILKSRNREFHCTIIGDGPEWENLCRRISLHGLDDHIALAGELTSDEVMKWYERAEILVAPSVVGPDGDRDGLPNAVLEAMAMKIPVVTSRCSGAHEAVEDGVNGYLVPENNAEELANRMETLLADRSLRRAMGAAGRRTVEESFDVAKNVKQLRKLFGEGPR